jgi:hypothetical protein
MTDDNRLKKKLKKGGAEIGEMGRRERVEVK